MSELEWTDKQIAKLERRKPVDAPKCPKCGVGFREHNSVTCPRMFSPTLWQWIELPQKWTPETARRQKGGTFGT
jgi:uncharacterized OB-fold protein